MVVVLVVLLLLLVLLSAAAVAVAVALQLIDCSGGITLRLGLFLFGGRCCRCY